MTARLVAAELPVAEGIEAAGVRTVIVTGARALAPMLLLCIVVAALLSVVAGRPPRATRTRQTELGARRLIIGMSLAATPIAVFMALVLLVATLGAPGNGWVIFVLGLTTSALALTLVFRTLAHRPEPPLWARILGLGPWPPLMLALTPMAIGIAGSLVVVAIALYTLPKNARWLDQVLEGPPQVLERVVGVVILVSTMVWYACFVSLTPPTVFNLAVVQLEDGRRISGAYFGRSTGAVVLARCDADPETAPRFAPPRLSHRERARLHRHQAFSRNGRFLSIPTEHIRWVRVTNRRYVFDPGRSRTVLGAWGAVIDIGPEIGSDMPWRASTVAVPDKPVCGGI